MTKSLRFALLSFVIAGFTTGIVAAQKKSEGSMKCRESYENDRLFGHCEIKEQTLPAGGAITVDGKTNGGVSIKGWERNEILVRSKIETRAPTQAEADQLAGAVRIETATLNIRAEGPVARDDYQWYVSYEIFVPRKSDLSLQAHNGGISITDVNEALNIKTTNGGVNLIMPDNYSAHLETGTVNGNVSFGFPVNVALTERGRMPKDVSVDLGSGGPTVRATTTNGGVRVGRASGVE